MDCPPAWTLYNQSCYFKVEQGYDWDSARAFCQGIDQSSNLADTTDIDYLKTINWDIWVTKAPKLFS